MKFGKQILAQQVPGWSEFYLDYKGLKKIVSSLTAGRPRSGPTALALMPGGGRESDEHKQEHEDTGRLSQSVVSARAPVSSLPFIPASEVELNSDQTLALLSASGIAEDRGPHFQAHKTAFFFKLERELEKINLFYLQKEAELKLRLETLLLKRIAAASRILPSANASSLKDHVEWKAVEEGFRTLERDLAKLQQFVDINAIGFRKILKKWDKRSKSTTKELYLARQVEVQPVFNHQLIGELSDIVTQCLLDLTDLSIGLDGESSIINDVILSHQTTLERNSRAGLYHDLETNLQNAIKIGNERIIRELVHRAGLLYEQPEGKSHVTRILWKAVIDAPAPLADLILSSPSTPFNFQFVDDINGRTCLHEAAISGQLRLIDICIEKDVQINRADVYGRTALHYAAMNGHVHVCRRLLACGLQPSVLDKDSHTSLMYAALKGDAECVKALLDIGHADVTSVTAHDPNPLLLACHSGHIEVVKLLLQHNAKSTPNTNGEFSIHIAAREGHSDICCLLFGYEGWDTPDKYNEWTPLFHAARNGHDLCVQVLLELGSRVNATDETGKQAVFYAAWFGHHQCVSLLLDASSKVCVAGTRRDQTPQTSPAAAATNESSETDLDTIPSLSLPPPIMPHRVYGHNFLDRACLVHVSIGHPFAHASHNRPPVQLSPRIAGTPTLQFPHATPLFKLVMTSKPDITSAPYSVSIPIRDEKDVFTFQTPNVEDMSLEFSIYPNFGTKTIGRAVALSSMLSGKSEAAYILPILDHHLHVIGEVIFEVRIITPFKGVALEIGGAVETYWKSLASPFNPSSHKPPLRMAQQFRTLGPAHVSPSNFPISGANGHTITLSSLIGDYIYLTIQVTRDLHPVIYGDWKLPVSEFDLGVSDVTLAQFRALSRRFGLEAFDASKYRTDSPSEWYRALRGSMLPLRDVMKVLPSSFGVYLDIASPTAATRKRIGLGHESDLDVDTLVDAVLRAMYSNTPSQQLHRRIVFGSFHPDICAALNWKQPNYAVFLSSECGVRSECPPSATALQPEDVSDRRLSSINSAVDWAKTNNLLGVIFDAEIFTKIPSLIQGVKDTGLLLGVYGTREHISSLLNRSITTTSTSTSTNNPASIPATVAGAGPSDLVLVDAYLQQQEGIISFLDQSSRNFF